MQLVIASRNVHKIRECKTILQQFLRVDLYSLIDFPAYQAPEETGATFQENAIIKAVHAAKALNMWTIADDSGLVVPALQGDPGVFSARYAGPKASDAENRKKLLLAMKSLHDHERAAYYECAIALSSPQGLKKCVAATCEGRLLEEEKGGGGFGYDPLFVKNDYNKTFAELEESLKNKISHRRKALDKIILTLQLISD